MNQDKFKEIESTLKSLKNYLATIIMTPTQSICLLRNVEALTYRVIESLAFFDDAKQSKEKK
jgi:hypothetical protein